jgi:acetyl-CoA carboxylase biotin carboxyl carrier protein
MEYKEIQNLIKLIDSTDLTELKLKQGDFELQIRTKEYYKFSGKTASTMVQAPVVQSAPAPPAAPVVEKQDAPPAPAASANAEAAAPVEKSADSNLVDIKSPIVGTFYRSPAPDKDVYVKIGDHIDVGSVVCIVEAMKLFNEIESEVSGKIVEILVEDATPVEYDQVLFRVEPA